MRGRGGAPYASVTRSAPSLTRRIVVAAALVAGLGVAGYGYVCRWTPLQRAYLVTYVRSAFVWPSSGLFNVLYVVDARGRRLAVDDELVTVTNAAGETKWALAAATTAAGATGLEWRRARYPNAALYRFLRQWIYGGQTPLALVTPPLWTVLVLALGGLLGARLQGAVEVGRARDPSPRWDPRPVAPPVVIDPVERPARALGPASEVPGRPPGTGPVAQASPKRLTSGSASEPVGASASPSRPPGSSRPFFQ